MRKRKLWGPREEYRTYLRKTCKLFPTLLGHIDRSRVFLCGFYARNSGHLAKITRNSNPWAVMIPDFDYAIQFWDPRFSQSHESMKIYVMLHELVHVPQGGFILGGPEWRKLIDHDVQEFNMLISGYGLNLENVRMVMDGEAALFDKLKHDRKDAKKRGIKRFPRLPIFK